LGEPGLHLRRARESAIARLDDHLTKVHRAERLNEDGLHSCYGRFHAGWNLVLEVDGKQFELVVLIGDTFPFEPPELRFTDQTVFLRFPHVDEKGKLCLTNAVATFSPNLITQTADFLISETRKLIGDSLAGRNESDFIQEFQSYWRCLPTFSAKKFWSLLKPESPMRCVRYYAATGFTLFGESDDEIKLWLKNYCGGSLPKGFNTKPTVLIWLREPLLPKRYPNTAHDILLLARDSSPNTDVFLESVIPREAGSLPLVFGFHTGNGPVLAGIQVPEPKTANRSNPTKQRNCRNDGFRAGHVPNKLLVARYFSETKLSLSKVTRVDAAWCLQRGGSGYDSELLSKRVAIVGCGSLGADVASILAKSGVGRFVLIDSDLLAWENIARHLLGGEAVGEAKASALANHLSRQMPWLETSYKSQKVETIVYERPKTLQECDLVISTTGDWASDCILNSAQRTFARFPPLIFGWTEPFGIAGHALAVLREGGCLACGTSEFGVFESRVTDWPEGRQPLVQATGCSDFYQPYGVADVAPTKAVIAEMALDILYGRIRAGELRTWVGNTSRLESLGGRFNAKWSEELSVANSGRRTFIQPWPINPKCPLCN
jgi:molybdopterin/thiamine biosynthesis adenylyltransferase